MNYQKYKRYETINFEERTWPSKKIINAPIWCSVDLRDGNQALPTPMSVEDKLEYFHMLLDLGFKEIEIGFPAASQIEYDFLRKLIEENHIPDDVKIQVLTQARAHLIEKTFEALEGVKNAVLHFYNSTSTLQRDVVFNKNRKEIIEIAVEGAKLVKSLSKKYSSGNVIYQYSPESFTGTEMDYAKDICEAVIDVFEPTVDNKMIVNLPATVEMSTPNVYADQIEWFCKNVKNRESLIISLHTHNDRGTGVAATELGLLAGADRVEGTLFGNGERTGNVDIVTLALNMFTQGIDPEIDFRDINKVRKIYERCTRMSVHPRHPYAGELVYTAFSGSHQDAINKGIHKYKERKQEFWEVPYLPIDPNDVGRQYEAIIRINSQSGKGGVSYILENEFGFRMPKIMAPEFGKIVQKISDETGKELKPDTIFEIFDKEYLNRDFPLKLKSYSIEEKQGLEGESANENVIVDAVVDFNNEEKKINGRGNGPIDAFYHGLMDIGISKYKFISYDEHALSMGSDSKAVAYIQIENGNGKRYFGVGMAQNISIASLKALLCAINRAKAANQQ